VTIRSIAVLPLENLSGNADEEYFADGMTDELITNAGAIRSLQVISRTSVMQYKKGRKPLPEIARELGWTELLRVRVARGGRVRVRAQLIYAPTDTHIWAESYERTSGDTLTLQQEVARSIAERVQLASAAAGRNDKSQSTRRSIRLPGCLLPRKVLLVLGSLREKREFFHKQFKWIPPMQWPTPDWRIVIRLHRFSGEESALETMPEAEAAAKKALELDDSLAEAHHALAAVKLFYRWDWEGAEKESGRALELNPSLG